MAGNFGWIGMRLLYVCKLTVLQAGEVVRYLCMTLKLLWYISTRGDSDTNCLT